MLTLDDDLREQLDYNMCLVWDIEEVDFITAPGHHKRMLPDLDQIEQRLT